ncbi:hypothetical protein V5T82_16810 [Magnetovibrio sp. PR-2]|uniref:hypothetical protein n=1 Tax=Magnetovibrio sp. PR-2 TaxID=3120356 RepID=UPI002FCE085B
MPLSAIRAVAFFLCAMTILPNVPTASPRAEREASVFIEECDPTVTRQTIVLIDLASVAQARKEFERAVLQPSGILGPNGLVDGEGYHILVFDSRFDNPSRFQYHIRGCTIGPKSRAAPAGRDPFDLADDKRQLATQQLSASLRNLVELAGVPSSDGYSPKLSTLLNALYGVTELTDNRDTISRLFVCANLYAHEQGASGQRQVPGAVVNQKSRITINDLNLQRVETHAFCVDNQTLPRDQSSRVAELYLKYWKGLLSGAGGKLASFGMDLGSPGMAGNSVPAGLPVILHAKGYLGPAGALDDKGIEIKLDLTMRNNGGKEMIDWLTVFRPGGTMSAPVKGMMTCGSRTCSYRGVVDGLVEDQAGGPKNGDIIEMVISQIIYGVVLKPGVNGPPHKPKYSFVAVVDR